MTIMNKKVFTGIIGVFGTIAFFSFTVTMQQQEPWKAPAEADNLKSPFTFTPEVVREGEKLFNIYCVSCHGKNGYGDGSPGKFKIEPANFHSKAVADESDGAIFWKMTNGRGGISMPSFKTALSDESRWQLVSYIRQFSKQGGAVASATNVVSPAGYRIDAKASAAYFPLPAKLKNVVLSEAQAFTVDTVVKGLDRPWSMVFLPDNTMLIAERGGKLLQVKNGKLQTTPIAGNIPEGLRDIKLHPQFEKNKLVYISYYKDPVRPDGGYSVLMRGKLEGNKLVDDKILYKAGPYRDNGEWFGNKLVFDKNGFLYFTIGSRTYGNMKTEERRKLAQDLSYLSGKILRFNDDGSIPADNPFVNKPGARPEIYSYGHRTPEGLVCDPKTGKVYATEFGELGGDELNVIKPGLNYGWPVVSYSLEYDGSIISESPFKAGMEPPVYHYAIAPSNVEFVYGSQYPGWDGNMFIGGLAAKMLYRVVMKNDVFVHDERLLDNIGRVRDVKYGPDNLLYVLTEDTGIIVRLLPVKKI